jgi:hypothetical protein
MRIGLGTVTLLVIVLALATNAPTDAPTPAPTPAPTSAPTDAPDASTPTFCHTLVPASDPLFPAAKSICQNCTNFAACSAVARPALGSARLAALAMGNGS